MTVLENPQDERLRLLVNDSIKKLFDKINIMRKSLHGIKKEKEFFSTSNIAKEPTNDRLVRDHEQSILQELEGFLKTNILEEQAVRFFSEKHISNFLFQVFAPGVYDVSVNITTSENFTGNLCFHWIYHKEKINKIKNCSNFCQKFNFLQY